MRKLAYYSAAFSICALLLTAADQKIVPVSDKARAEYWEAQANQLAAQLKEAQGQVLTCEARSVVPKLTETLNAKITALCPDTHAAVMEGGVMLCKAKPEEVSAKK